MCFLCLYLAQVATVVSVAFLFLNFFCMKTERFILIIISLVVVYLLIKKDGGGSKQTETEVLVTSSPLPDAAYSLDIPSSMYEVLIDDDESNAIENRNPRLRVTFRCSLRASSDMWIPNAVSFVPGVKTGFHVILYGAEGPLRIDEKSDVSMFVDTDAETSDRGIYLPAGQLVQVSVIVDQPFRVGLMGVRLHSGRVYCTDPRLPEGIVLPFTEAAFDTGLIRCDTKNLPLVEPEDRGRKA